MTQTMTRRIMTWTLAATALTAAGCHSLTCDCTDHGAAKPAFRDEFDPGWNETQTDWEIATWMQNGAQMDPARCRANGQGQLVQTVLAGDPPRGGSLQTNREFGYGRWLARVKPSAVPGVLNSIFTKDWDDLTTDDDNGDGTKFEVDIEFLTYTFKPGGGQVHLAIHARRSDNEGDEPIYAADPELDFNPSDAYHVWGFDIYPDRVVWHVDGVEIARTRPPADVEFNAGYEFFFNSWTRDAWINGPPAADAHYHIDWVRFYPVGTFEPLENPDAAEQGQMGGVQ